MGMGYGAKRGRVVRGRHGSGRAAVGCLPGLRCYPVTGRPRKPPLCGRVALQRTGEIMGLAAWYVSCAEIEERKGGLEIPSGMPRASTRL